MQLLKMYVYIFNLNPSKLRSAEINLKHKQWRIEYNTNPYFNSISRTVFSIITNKTINKGYDNLKFQYTCGSFKNKITFL